MNPIAAVIAAFVALKHELHTRFNASLTKLPPLEQIEGGTAVLSVIREVDWAQERMQRVGTDVEATLAAAANLVSGFEKKANEPIDALAARLLDAFHEQAGTAALAAALAAGTHMLASDHATVLNDAVTKAARKATEDAEVAFSAKLEDIATLAARRNEAVAKVGAVAAAALKDSDLLGGHHAALLATIEGRVAKLTAAGITAEARPLGYASLLAVGLDEAGDAEFESRLNVLKETGSPAVPVAAAKPTPSTPAGALPTTPAAPDPKKTVI